MIKVAFKRSLSLISKQAAPMLWFKPAAYFNVKKYTNNWDLSKPFIVEMTDYLATAHTCNMIANMLKDNLHQITDRHLCFALLRIWEDDIELDQSFNNIIIPIVKEFVKNFDRECNQSLANLIQYSAFLKVQDDALWQLFESKLVKERLYRYIPLKELCKVAYAMAEAGKGSPECFGNIEKVLIKHRLNLREDDLELAKIAFEKRPLGSQLLLEVLGNPTGDFQAMEQRERERTQKKIQQH
eukprot:CAMPEP_0176437280 /NCGR_PEP_ID=MMETSP0127-20121128/18516_1 /TAXON_ID=938130 /ORGANISM="Platyophrya macrostoma, Strain WH" /LENGTH=240 /DNA_ID=CAMNT_0017820853 /DNA_START=26 /DNA_END=748 /DNA_ORIENTATION=+